MALEIILLIVGALGTYEGYRLTHTTLLYHDGVGPGWYLLFMAGLLLFCAIALAARKLVARGAVVEGEGIVALHKSSAGRAFFLLFLYAAGIFYIGYIAGSLLFFSVVQRVFGERSWVRCALIGAAITAGFWFIFSYLASVPLP
jgi:hypothetical protein